MILGTGSEGVGYDAAVLLENRGLPPVIEILHVRGGRPESSFVGSFVALSVEVCVLPQVYPAAG